MNPTDAETVNLHGPAGVLSRVDTSESPLVTGTETEDPGTPGNLDLWVRGPRGQTLSLFSLIDRGLVRIDQADRLYDEMHEVILPHPLT